MRFSAAKWIAMSVVSTAAFACASISTEADACCGFFSCLFGCGGCGPRCYRPAYPCAPSGCSTGTYYGAVAYNNCSPCATGCSPCVTGNCSTGNCAVGSTLGSSTSVPAPDPDPNFKAKQKSGTPDTYMRGQNGDVDSELGNSGKLPRTNPDTNTDDGASRLNRGDGSSGFAKPRNATSTDADDADDDSGTGSTNDTGAGSSKSSKKKSPGVPRASDGTNDENGARHAPTISLDEKVAWRAAPVRSRMETKSRTASARLVRLPAYPKSEWLPVDADSKIAKN